MLKEFITDYSLWQIQCSLHFIFTLSIYPRIQTQNYFIVILMLKLFKIPPAPGIGQN